MKHILLFVGLQVTLGLLLLGYALAPVKPALLGQWSVATEGSQVAVPGTDLRITVQDISERVYDDMGLQWKYTTVDVTLHADGQETDLPKKNSFVGEYVVRRRLAGPFLFVNIDEGERGCSSIQDGSEHVRCYMNLMRERSDISVCGLIDDTREHAVSARCYWAYAYHTGKKADCSLIPQDIPHAAFWTDYCLDTEGIE